MAVPATARWWKVACLWICEVRRLSSHLPIHQKLLKSGISTLSGSTVKVFGFDRFVLAYQLHTYTIYPKGYMNYISVTPNFGCDSPSRSQTVVVILAEVLTVSSAAFELQLRESENLCLFFVLNYYYNQLPRLSMVCLILRLGQLLVIPHKFFALTSSNSFQDHITYLFSLYGFSLIHLFYRGCCCCSWLSLCSFSYFILFSCCRFDLGRATFFFLWKRGVDSSSMVGTIRLLAVHLMKFTSQALTSAMHQLRYVLSRCRGLTGFLHLNTDWLLLLRNHEP